MPKVGVLAEPPLVGREKELEQLSEFLNFVVEGKGKTVFVSGEAGSGKTRLTREFLNAVLKRGISVMAGWCLSDSQVPYFPFMEAFNNFYASSCEEGAESNLLMSQAQLGLGSPARVGIQRGNSEITSWLAGQKPTETAIVLSPQAWKDQVFAAVSETLHAIANQTPLVLFVEDVHWADSASLALLHYIARAIHDSEKILLLATFRSEELTSDAEGHPHPLAETLRMMRREELFAETKLSSLRLENISRIAKSMIGGDLQTIFAEKLTNESKGNPLFVVESLRMLYERKSLLQENGEWRLTVDELNIPSKIKDIILRRLACLKYAQRRVLDAASVIGEKFDVGLLSAVLGQDSLDVLETLNVIAHSTSLVGVEENYYMFDHARSRETLYDEIALPLKRGYHGRIAEQLETASSATLPLSDLAYHFAQSGNKEKALKYALAAGRDELARFSNAQAIQHFKYVLQNIPEGQVGEKRTAMEGLGDAYAANNMYLEAIKVFDDLAASETGTARVRGLRKASDAAFCKGDNPNLLIEYAKKAEELGVNDRLEMARIINNRGRAWGWSGQGKPGLDMADYCVALQVFEEENSLPDVAEALWRSGVAACATTDLKKEELCKLLRSVAIFKELGDVRKEIMATHYLGCGFLSYGLLSKASLEFTKVLREGEKLGIFLELSSTCSFLSELYDFDEKIGEALSSALKGLEYCRKTDAVALVPVYSYLAQSYSKIGDLKHAEECFEIIAKQPPNVVLQAQYFVDSARSVYLAAKGREEESNQLREKKYGFIGTNPPIYQKIRRHKESAWALEKQGRLEEANIQRGFEQKLLELVNETFKHAEIQLSVMVPRKVHVGEEFEMRVDLVNVGREPGELVKIEGITRPEFEFVDIPSYCNSQKGAVQIKDKVVNGFQVETIKLKLKATEMGSYALNPEVFYSEDLGATKTFRVSPIMVTVQPAKPVFEVLPGRITTGLMELDRLLFGGIPERYAVVLTAPSCDEREMLVNRFLNASAIADEIIFYITTEAGSTNAFAKNPSCNNYAFLCSPGADIKMENSSKVFRLKGVENLTELDIALNKAFRTLPTGTNPRRFCLEILSDVLLQHHALITRKWLSALLPSLKAKGFTTLAVIDPRMHPAEETQAVLSLFDGEIRLSQRKGTGTTEKFLGVIKLCNQRFSENEIALTREKNLLGADSSHN